MTANRMTPKFVGAFFLISNATFLVGAVVFLESNLGASDYLTQVSANRPQIILGVLLELINAVAYIGIAGLMFPFLRKQSISVALVYVGLRVIEFGMQILSDLSPLALLSLSEEFVSAGSPAASSFQTLGSMLLSDRYWAMQMVSITFGLGAMMFYSLLYQSKLIPRFISVWGFIGAAIVLANTILEMFGINPGNLGVIMLFNELFLGVWLIVKGFSPSAVASTSAKHEQTQYA